MGHYCVSQRVGHETGVTDTDMGSCFLAVPCTSMKSKPVLGTYMSDQPRKPQGAVSVCMIHIWC
jgi:hypothetical protein